jgi:hypothetical protein
VWWSAKKPSDQCGLMRLGRCRPHGSFSLRSRTIILGRERDGIQSSVPKNHSPHFISTERATSIDGRRLTDSKGKYFSSARYSLFNSTRVNAVDSPLGIRARVQSLQAFLYISAGHHKKIHHPSFKITVSRSIWMFLTSFCSGSFPLHDG